MSNNFLPKSYLAQFDGALDYLRAFRLIADLRLARYFLLPGLISLALGWLMVAALIWLADDVGAWLYGFYPFEFGRELAGRLSPFFGGLIMLALGLLLYRHVLMIVLAQFLSPLSQKVEAHLTGRVFAEGGMADNLSATWRGLRFNLWMLWRELALVLLLSVLAWVPFVGGLAAPLIFVVQAYYAGLGNFDFTLERHFGLQQSIAYGRRHRWLCIGNGSVFLLLLFVPVVGLMTAPVMAVLAGTRTVLRSLAADGEM